MQMDPGPGGQQQQFDRAIFDHLAEGVVWQAADGRVVDANAAAAPILGLSRDELLGRTPQDPRWQAIHEDCSPWPGDTHPSSVALRSGVAQRGLVMGVISLGRGRRWLSIHALPMFDGASPTPTGVVVSFVDVTPQIELRRQLEDTSRELSDLYEQAPCGYHMLDRNGQFLRINQTELQWLGVSREQVLGRMGPSDFLSPDSRDTFRRNFPRILSGEPLRGLELEIVGAQGRRMAVRLDADPVRDDAGQVMATRSVMHDITEARARAQALAQLNAEQAALLNNDLVSIVRLRNRRIVWTNPAFGRIFGYGPDELLDRTSACLFDDDEAYQAFSDAAYPPLQAGQSFRGRLLLRHKDGSRVVADCSGVMLEASAEVVWFSVDVTAQVRAEEQRLLAAEIEAENRQLKETNRLHRLFLSAMSHELRTPLNAVIGFAHLVEQGARSGDADRLARYGGLIGSSGRHLLGMIDSILETAHAEAGRMVLHPHAVDVQACVDEVVAMLDISAAEAAVEVQARVAVDRPLRLDPLRLRQILVNLASNAVKFSRPGGRVQVRAACDDAGQLRIEVEDHGIGIAPADLPGLFRTFHQLSTGTTKTSEGTGIGLALVRMLAEAHSGTVGVTSEPGVGSVFHVVLPELPDQPQ